MHSKFTTALPGAKIHNFVQILWPQLWRSCREAVEKLWRSCREAVEKLSRSCREVVEKLLRSCGQAVEKLLRSCGEAVEKMSTCCGEAVDGRLRQLSKFQHNVKKNFRDFPFVTSEIWSGRLRQHSKFQPKVSKSFRDFPEIRNSTITHRFYDHTFWGLTVRINYYEQQRIIYISNDRNILISPEFQCVTRKQLI